MDGSIAASVACPVREWQLPWYAPGGVTRIANSPDLCSLFNLVWGVVSFFHTGQHVTEAVSFRSLAPCVSSHPRPRPPALPSLSAAAPQRRELSAAVPPITAATWPELTRRYLAAAAAARYLASSEPRSSALAPLQLPGQLQNLEPAVGLGTVVFSALSGRGK